MISAKRPKFRSSGSDSKTCVVWLCSLSAYSFFFLRRVVTALSSFSEVEMAFSHQHRFVEKIKQFDFV